MQTPQNSHKPPPEVVAVILPTARSRSGARRGDHRNGSRSSGGRVGNRAGRASEERATGCNICQEAEQEAKKLRSQASAAAEHSRRGHQHPRQRQRPRQHLPRTPPAEHRSARRKAPPAKRRKLDSGSAAPARHSAHTKLKAQDGAPPAEARAAATMHAEPRQHPRQGKTTPSANGGTERSQCSERAHTTLKARAADLPRDQDSSTRGGDERGGDRRKIRSAGEHCQRAAAHIKLKAPKRQTSQGRRPTAAKSAEAIRAAATKRREQARQPSGDTADQPHRRGGKNDSGTRHDGGGISCQPIRTAARSRTTCQAQRQRHEEKPAPILSRAAKHTPH